MYTSAIVIPCYNEFARLPVDSFIDHLVLHPDHAFIFVNDGSTDLTIELFEKIKSTCNNAYFVDLKNNIGKAEAVRAGMAYGTKEISSTFYGYIDADLATPLSFIEVMEAVLAQEKNLDMVFGSRELAAKDAVERKTFRHVAGRLVSGMLNWALTKKYHDTQCGAKLFSTKAATYIFEKPFTTTWIFDVEIIKRLETNPDFGSQVIKEIPVNQWKDVGNSKVSTFYFFRLLGEVMRVKRMK